LPSITYLPAGTRVDCAAGESVFEVARRAGINVTTACVGKATCGLCRVKVIHQQAAPLLSGAAR
jgi:2Fe-2S ferredoxin